METKQCASAQTPEFTLPSRLRKPRLRRSEAVEYLEQVHGLTVAKKTLEAMATRGGGPKFQKFSNSPMYPASELDIWAAEKLGPLVSSTSEL